MGTSDPVRCWSGPHCSPLSRVIFYKVVLMDLRELTYAINGAVFEVHNTLGDGFLEKVYENALLVELKDRGIHSDSQVPVQVFYKGEIVGEYLADIVVENAIMLELKTVDELTSLHQAQLMNYLKASDKKIGLLINFKGQKATIRRIVAE